MREYPIFEHAKEEIDRIDFLNRIDDLNDALNDVMNLAFFGKKVIDGLQKTNWPEDIEALILVELEHFIKRVKMIKEIKNK